MNRRWVTNASPIILLGKVGQIELLSMLSEELVVPEAVAREVREKADGRSTLQELASSPTTRIERQVRIPSEVEVWDLGRGESQVIAKAASDPGARAVLDDREALRCGEALGIPLIGTLGVVLRARSQGLIEAARPVIKTLRNVGLYVTDDLIERALAHLGE